LADVDPGRPTYRYDRRVPLSLGPAPADARPEDRCLIACHQPAVPVGLEERRQILARMAAESADAVFSEGRTAGCIPAEVEAVYARRHTGGRSYVRMRFRDPTGEVFDWVVPEVRLTDAVAAAGGLDMTAAAAERLRAAFDGEAYLVIGLGDRNDRMPGRYDGRHPLVVGAHPFGPNRHLILGGDGA